MRILIFLLKCFPFLLVFVIVWVLAVLFWRASGNVPSIMVAGLILLGVPIALILGYFGLTKGIEIAKNKAAARPQAADASQNASEAGDDAGDAERAYSLEIHAGSLRLSNGADAATVVAAVKDNKSPELHPNLVDHKGLPVFAATVAAADPDTVETAWDVLESSQTEALEPVHRRALALAAQVLDDLIVQAGTCIQTLEASGALAPEFLETVLLLPEDWSDATRQAGRDWLQQHVNQAGEDTVRLQIKALPVSDTGQVLTTIDEYRLTLNRRQQQAPMLLAACDSFVDEQTVHRWSTTGRLKASGNDEGKVPGEGAAGLLVGRPAPNQADDSVGQSASAGGEDAQSETKPLPHLYRLARDAHEQSVDGGGRRKKNTALLDALIMESLGDAGYEPSEVGSLISDADTRPSRSQEVAQSVDTILPEIDSAADTVPISIVAGDCGCAAVLAGIAVGFFQVQEQQTPVVFTSVADAQARAALVVALPAAPGEGDAQAAAEQASVA